MNDCIMGPMPSCIYIFYHVTLQFFLLKEKRLYPPTPLPPHLATPAFRFQFSHMTCSGQKNEKEKQTNMEPCFEFRFQRPLYVLLAHLCLC